MRKILIRACLLLVLFACKNEAEKTAQPMVAGEATKGNPPVEFADQKYIDMAKAAWTKFATGDVEGWAQSLASNAVFRWSSGDSLAGKEAIVKYWKDRHENVIQDLVFSNDIWLPVKVNEPQGPESKGVWLLNWYKVKATYTNKESLTFWVHTDMHYNSENMVDEMIQYIDRAPINAALAKGK